MSLLRSTLVSSTCTSMVGVGTGVPFGYIVTADGGISTFVSSSSGSSSPASLRSGKRRRVTSGGLDRRLSARMGVGALFAQHAACSAASTRPPRARALGMPAARLPTWPGRAWLAPARHRSGAPEARFARCWLSPRRRFHVSPAQSGAETSRKCASSQLLMDLRREPSSPIKSTAGPARPSGASFKRAV